MSTTTDAPPLDGMELHHGLWVAGLGEDGDLLVAGHHPLMRAVAALNSYSRRNLGWTNLADDRTTTLDDIAPAIEQRWATQQTYADCDDREDEGPDHQCPMCCALDDGNWWIAIHNEERPGSFPITWMSA